MPVNNKVVNDASKMLLQAERAHQSIEPLIKQFPDMTIDEAYYTQLKVIDHKVENGAVITGKKIGLTSISMQQLLGVDQPDYGHLLKEMEVIGNNREVSLGSLFDPKVEGEIAFILKEDLVGPNITREDVLKATEFIAPALEIVDSRIKDWDITLADTVADNASCGLYLIGDNKINPANIDMTTIEMELLKNDEVINSGTGADVLGHPANCVAWLANTLHRYDIVLKRGEVILSGALSAAIVPSVGDVFTAKFTELDEVSLKFVK